MGLQRVGHDWARKHRSTLKDCLPFLFNPFFQMPYAIWFLSPQFWWSSWTPQVPKSTSVLLDFCFLWWCYSSFAWDSLFTWLPCIMCFCLLLCLFNSFDFPKNNSNPSFLWSVWGYFLELFFMEYGSLCWQFIWSLKIVVLIANSQVKWSEVAQLCLTLCDPMDCSLPGSSVYGIFQARVLEWVAISFSIKLM